MDAHSDGLNDVLNTMPHPTDEESLTADSPPEFEALNAQIESQLGQIEGCTLFPFGRHESSFILGEEDQLIRLESEAACSVHEGCETPHEQPVKYLILSNGLQVVLLNDFGRKNGAAHLTVASGTFQDPKEYSGVAHVLEHMVYLGSQKYPDENHLTNFVSKHNGDSHAQTGEETTYYQFDMDAHEMETSQRTKMVPFQEALDRLAHLLIAPHLAESVLQREIYAVDAEHDGMETRDHVRLDLIRRQWANPDHPFSRYMTAPKDGLKDYNIHQITAAVREYFVKHYSANIMTLCVAAPFPLEFLQRWVEKSFSDIPNYNFSRELNYIDKPIYLPSARGLRLRIASIVKISYFEICWITPPAHRYYSTQAMAYVSTLLGHRGEGSIFSYFKKQSWATEISTPSNKCISFTEFSLKIRLTSLGRNHVEEIIQVIYMYLAMLRVNGIPDQFREEMTKKFELDCDTRRYTSPDLAESVSKAMLFAPLDRCLLAQDRQEKFSPTLIQEFLSFLTPTNAVIMECNAVAQDGVVHIEPRNQAWYFEVRVNESVLQKWTDVIPDGRVVFMPAKNTFVPSLTNLHQVHEGIEEDATILRWNNLMQIKHIKKQMSPLGEIRFRILSSKPFRTVTEYSLHHLLAYMMLDQLEEALQPAMTFGLSFGITPTSNGLHVGAKYFLEHLEQVFAIILKTLSSFKVHPNQFMRVVENVADTFTMKRKEEPSYQAENHTTYLLRTNFWHNEQLTDNMNAIRQNPQQYMAVLQQTKNSMFRRMYAALTVSGALEPSQILKMGDQIMPSFQYKVVVAQNEPVFGVVRLPQGEDIYVRERNNDSLDLTSAVEVNYQLGKADEAGSVPFLKFVSAVMNRAIYNELRTKQQLGYVVGADTKELHGVYFIRLFVQSPIRNVDEILESIEAFVNRFRLNTVENIQEESWEEFVKTNCSDTELYNKFSKVDVLNFLDYYIIGLSRRRLITQVSAEDRPIYVVDLRKVVKRTMVRRFQKECGTW